MCTSIGNDATHGSDATETVAFDLATWSAASSWYNFPLVTSIIISTVLTIVLARLRR